MRDLLYLLRPVLGYGASAAMLWWMVNRTYTMNNVGWLAKLDWPYNSAMWAATAGAILGLVKGTISLVQRHRRANEATRFARLLELSHQPHLVAPPVVGLAVFKGWTKGEHVMVGLRNGLQVTLLDYTAAQGKGDDADWIERTLVLIPIEGIPSFELHSRTGAYRVLSAMGFRGITFDPTVAGEAAASVQRFGELFHLSEKGIEPNAPLANEEPIRKLFTTKLLETLSRLPGRSAQVENGYLAVWSGDKTLPLRERKRLLDDALRIWAALQQSAVLEQTPLPALPGMAAEQQQGKTAATALGVVVGIFVGFVLGSTATFTVFFSSSVNPVFGMILFPIIFFGSLLGGGLLGGFVGSRYSLVLTPAHLIPPEELRQRKTRQILSMLGGLTCWILGFIAGAWLLGTAQQFGFSGQPFAVNAAWLVLTSFIGLLLGGLGTSRIVRFMQRPRQDHIVPVTTSQDPLPRQVPKGSFSLLGGILAPCFLGLGLAFVGVATWYAYEGYTFGRGALQVEGSVIRLDHNGEGAAPVVQFVAQGQPITIVANVSSSPPAYAVGDPVTVLYHADEPHRGMINSWTERWFFALLFGGLGSLFAVIGWAMLARSKKQK